MSASSSDCFSTNPNFSSIPTLLVFKNGREIDRMVGVQPKPEIVRRLEQVIG